MKVTYLGHACVNIEINGKYFLVDPFISANPLAKHIDINSVPAQIIFLLLTLTATTLLMWRLLRNVQGLS